MNDKKYKFDKTDKIKLADGMTAYRIVALRDVRIGVKKGDRGGYIVSEKNLAHGGTCWVGDNALVYEDAIVEDDAYVGDFAEVYGSAKVVKSAKVLGRSEVCEDAYIGDGALIEGRARIYNEACVSGNAFVSGFAQVFDKARVYGNAIIECDAVVRENAVVREFAIVGSGGVAAGNAVVRDRVCVQDRTTTVIEPPFDTETVRSVIGEFIARYNKERGENYRIDRIKFKDNEFWMELRGNFADEHHVGWKLLCEICDELRERKLIDDWHFDEDYGEHAWFSGGIVGYNDDEWHNAPSVKEEDKPRE